MKTFFKDFARNFCVVSPPYKCKYLTNFWVVILITQDVQPQADSNANFFAVVRHTKTMPNCHTFLFNSFFIKSFALQKETNSKGNKLMTGDCSNISI